MPSLDLTSTLVIVVLWIVGIVLCAYKYFACRKAGRKVESWMWFGFWCFFILFTEWVVYFGAKVVCKVGIGCLF